MNPDTPPSPREQLESRLTALLLGELSPEDAAALREIIQNDARLAQLYGRMQQTIALVRETAANPAEQTAAPATPLKLSDDRRQKLLAQFKTVTPKEFVKPAARQRSMSEFLIMAAAILVVICVCAGLLLPSLAKAKRKALYAAYQQESDELKTALSVDRAVPRKEDNTLTVVPGIAGPVSLAKSDGDRISASGRLSSERLADGRASNATDQRKPEDEAVFLKPYGATPIPPARTRVEIALPPATEFADAKQPNAAFGFDSTTPSTSDKFGRELAAGVNPVPTESIDRPHLHGVGAINNSDFYQIPAPTSGTLADNSKDHFFYSELNRSGGTGMGGAGPARDPAWTGVLEHPEGRRADSNETITRFSSIPTADNLSLSYNGIEHQPALTPPPADAGALGEPQLKLATQPTEPPAAVNFDPNTGLPVAAPESAKPALGVQVLAENPVPSERELDRNASLAPGNAPSSASTSAGAGPGANFKSGFVVDQGIVGGIGGGGGGGLGGAGGRAQQTFDTARLPSAGDAPQPLASLPAMAGHAMVLGGDVDARRKLKESEPRDYASAAAPAQLSAEDNWAFRSGNASSTTAGKEIKELETVAPVTLGDAITSRDLPAYKAELPPETLGYAAPSGKADSISITNGIVLPQIAPDAPDNNGQEATLSVTTAQPIFATTAGTQGSPGGSQVTYTNLGTILKVTPRVSANDTINLKVVPEVSDLGGTTRITSGDARFYRDLNRRSPATDKLSDLQSSLPSENKQARGEAQLAASKKPQLTAGINASEKQLEEIDQKIAGASASLEKSRKTFQMQAQVKEPDAPPARPPVPAAVPQPEVQSQDNAFSTFSLNVSDVSFKLAAASLEKGVMPDPSTIRSEEFINAFDYRDPEPPAGTPIGFAWERSQYPFAQNRDLLRFSVKTAAQGRQQGQPLNIVLLLDNSGSMERADRVQIIHEALRVLAAQLQPQDMLSVVTFARTPRLRVDAVPGNQAADVVEKISGLTPEGGTNLEEAMRLAYETARRHYLAKGINRVVLLTDGAANLGNVNPEALKQKVESNRKQGIALDCFGIGWEGYNDDLLEVLSRNGDGRYGFINTPEEAATGFAGQLAGALHVAAADVKVQVEFNPKRATAYRQLGYAKHQLTKQQFRDNTVDAAEIGAAESGNALYVVEVNPQGEGPLATVRVRYKVPGTSDYREQAWPVPYNGSCDSLDKASPAMRLSATASAFSEWLTSSPYAADVTPDSLLGYMSGVPEIYGADTRPKKLEWMVRQAKSISGK